MNKHAKRSPAWNECSEKRKVLAEKKISLHGVALEVFGKGVLITGPSGIGKTTAAMTVVDPDVFWIADDLAVIGKDKAGFLVMTGHRKIKKYLHTEKTGIIEVSRLFPEDQIKSKTRLDAVIAVGRCDDDQVLWEWSEQDVLDEKLPCLKISIPRTGYFDENLLKKAIKQCREVV